MDVSCTKNIFLNLECMGAGCRRVTSVKLWMRLQFTDLVLESWSDRCRLTQENFRVLPVGGDEIYPILSLRQALVLVRTTGEPGCQLPN